MQGSPLKYLKAFLLAGAVIGLLLLVQNILWVVQLLTVGLLVVYALIPVVHFLEKRVSFPHWLAVSATFSAFLLFIVLIVSLIIPIIQQEVRNILVDFPFFVKQLQNIFTEIIVFLEEYNIASREQVDIMMRLPTEWQPIFDQITSWGKLLSSGLLEIFLLLFIVFYLLYDFDSIRASWIDMVPPSSKKTSVKIRDIIDNTFGRYIQGTAVRCCIVGLVVGFSMYIIGMPYALLLGVMAAIFDVILYIGPYMAALPAILISLSPDTPSIIIVVIIYVFVQILESIVLSPLLLGKAIKLRPITVILCLLMGQQFAGFLGMLLFVPLAGIIKKLIETFYLGEELKANTNKK